MSDILSGVRVGHFIVGRLGLRKGTLGGNPLFLFGLPRGFQSR